MYFPKCQTVPFYLGKYDALVSPQERRDMVCCFCFFLKLEHCVQQTSKRCPVHRVISLSSIELFKQFLMDTSLCLTWELTGEQEVMDLGDLMQLKQ